VELEFPGVSATSLESRLESFAMRARPFPGLGAALLLAAPTAVQAEAAAAAEVDLVLVQGAEALRVIDGDRLVCVTMDWWPGDKYSKNPGAHYPWVNSSVLTVTLDDPTLRSALAALSPVRLRVGGSLADQITYDVDSNASDDAGDDDDAGGTACLEPVANASEVLGYGPGCIDGARYTALHALCGGDSGGSSVGVKSGSNARCQLAFGLNGLFGRMPAPDTEALWTGPWDPTDAEKLLRFTRDSGLRLDAVGTHTHGEARYVRAQKVRTHGHTNTYEAHKHTRARAAHNAKVPRVTSIDATQVELGNEIDGAAGIAAKIDPATYAADFLALRNLVDEVWPEEGGGMHAKVEASKKKRSSAHRPLVVGPDSSGFSDSWW